MSREQELEVRVHELEIENGELKGRVTIAEQQVEDARKAVQTYIDEITKLGKSAMDTVKNLGIIQEQGMAVRRRLGKVSLCLVAAEQLIRMGYEAGAEPGRIAELKVLYTQAKERLKTPDGEQSAEQQPAGGPDAQAPDDRK